MTDDVQAILMSALQLPLEDRARIAQALIESLDGEPDEDVEAAWAEEIERRARRVLEEGSRGRPWEEIRAELRRQR